MGTQLFSWIRRCTVLLIITAMVLAGMGKISDAAAAASTEQQAKQQKAESVIQIAQEYMKRMLYLQAQVQLTSAEQDYGRFLTDAQKQKVAELKGQIQTALEERKKIAAAMEQSSKLLEQGNPAQAKEILSQIQYSTFLSDAERKLVLTDLKTADDKLAALQAIEKQAAEQKAAEQKALEQKALEQKAAEQKALEQQAIEQKALEQKALDQKALEQQALEKQAEPQSVQTEPNGTVLPSQPVMTEVLPAQPQAAAAEPVVSQSQPQQEAVTAQPGTESTAVSPQQENSYLVEVQRKRAVQVSYTKAVVTDALSKAQESLDKKDFEAARSSLRKAFSTIEHNRMLLEGEYASLKTQLTQKEEAVNVEEKNYTALTAQDKQTKADQMTRDVREKMDIQRSQAVQDYMERAYAFEAEERYDEALGQIEQLLAIDPHNQNALIKKKTLENTVLWKEQLRIQRDSDKEEIELILEANRRSIPFSKEINYPKNWKEISARRDKEDEKSPMDSAINKLLDQVVNLSSLTEETTLGEAIEILRNSVEPPLSITVMWKDLNENAFIQQDTPINMSGQSLVAIPLKIGLERVLQSVSAGAMATLGYVIEYGTITIATTDNLPTTYKNEVYDVSELLNPPANYDEYNGGISSGGGGGMGGGGGGGMGGGGGGMGGGGGGMGGGGMGGGGMGGGGMGGGGMGGGGMGGGGMGGGMGGGGGGMGGGGGGMGGGQMVGNWQSRYRGYELMYTILQTVEPTSWDPELSDVGEGEGRIMPFGDNQLIIWQTPPVQEKIRKFLDELGKNLGQQIAIEARFLLVDENYLKDVGLDVDINRLRIGGVHSIMHAIPSGEQGVITGVDSNYDSISLVSPSATKIRSSLGGATTSTQAMKMDFAYGGTMDDLQVDFMIKATQIHQNSRQLTAPKAMVLSGESATLEVWTTKSVRTDSTLGTENVTAGQNILTTYTIDDTYSNYSSGVRLSITPTILNKKYVLLRISTYLMDVDIGEPEDLTLGFDQNLQAIKRNIFFPSTDLSSIQTRVSVPDRGTVLLGGQTLTASKQKEAGVPILSKIPILGRFFSNSSDVQDKRILLILVKPTIVLKEEAEEEAIAAMGSGS